MSRILFLDTGPLGIVTNPKKPSATVEVLHWAAAHVRAGNHLMVPAIADYEVRRELTRLGRAQGIASLDAWNGILPNRYVALTDSALRLASELWAQARQIGSATADPKELDCDVLIAAQALDYRNAHDIPVEDLVIATVNVGHLAQFLAADLWQNITP